MSKLLALVAWLDAHALTIAAVLATATGILRAFYALLSRVLAPYPRARAFVEAVAAMAPDVLRFAQQLFRLATGRDLPSTQPASVVPPAPTPADAVRLTSPTSAARLAGEVALADVGRASVAPPAPIAPAAFDPSARQAIAPEVVAAAQQLTAAPVPLAHTPASALHGARWEPPVDPNAPKEPA